MAQKTYGIEGHAFKIDCALAASLLLYQIVEQCANVFFAHLCERNATLPGFVRDEF